MDLITGGELFDHLSNDGAYSEADAARLVFEIASALAFMHGVGVIHGDIKPENLMLCSRKRRGGTIKIIDFGCAITQPVGHYDAAGTITDNDESDSSSNLDGGPAETGTTGYWPPERFQGHKLTPTVDTWALGIILYIMLMGFHPFDVNCDRSDEEVAAAIQKNPLPPMDEKYVGHLSESVKDLIRRLMEPDPDKRMTAYELMHHEWVQGETATTKKIEDSDKRLSKFQDLRYKLEASVFAVLVNQGHANLTMSESKRNNTEVHRNSGVSIMKSVFDVFDKDGKGYVTGEDIGKVVTAQTGQELKTHDANEFLKDGNQESELSLSGFSNLFSGMKHKHFPVSSIVVFVLNMPVVCMTN
jgi:serine/threonine protein kinase